MAYNNLTMNDSEPFLKVRNKSRNLQNYSLTENNNGHMQVSSTLHSNQDSGQRTGGHHRNADGSTPILTDIKNESFNDALKYTSAHNHSFVSGGTIGSGMKHRENSHE